MSTRRRPRSGADELSSGECQNFAVITACIFDVKCETLDPQA